MILKWLGGKRQLLPEIKGQLPDFIEDGEVFDYYEPFFGGGALYFNYISEKRLRSTLLTDSNRELMNFYVQLNNNMEELFLKCSDIQERFLKEGGLLDKQDFYNKVREQFNEESLSEIDRAATFFFLNKKGYNGLYRVNKKGKFNVPFNKNGKPFVDYLKFANTKSRLENTSVFCADFTYLYSVKFAKDTPVFVYLDPPYYPVKSTSFTNYQNNFGLTEMHHLRRVCSFLNSQGVYFLLHNSNHHAVHQVFEDYNMKQTVAGRSINSDGGGRGPVSELIITNYE